MDTRKINPLAHITALPRRHLTSRLAHTVGLTAPLQLLTASMSVATAYQDISSGLNRALRKANMDLPAAHTTHRASKATGTISLDIMLNFLTVNMALRITLHMGSSSNYRLSSNMVSNTEDSRATGNSKVATASHNKESHRTINRASTKHMGSHHSRGVMVGSLSREGTVSSTSLHRQTQVGDDVV